MAKLNIAVIGAGFMGRLHARTIAESDVAEVAAVIDPSEAAGRAVADAWGGRYAPTLDGIPLVSFDAAVVAVPDQLHEAVTCALLGAGKPVLVEKPLAHTLGAAQAIARAERAGGGRLLVGHILRFDPRYVAAAAAVKAGRIGTPRHASSGRFTLRDVGQRLNGASSPCFYLGIHDVDALQWITGASVRTVYSRSIGSASGAGGPDAIFTTCEMTEGLAGQLHCGWTLPSSSPTGIWARTEVVGTEGIIDLDVRNGGLRLLAGERWSLPDTLHWPDTNGRIGGDLCEEIRHFVRAIRDDTPFVMSTDDALRAVSVNDAILRSVASGRPETVAEWRV